MQFAVVLRVQQKWHFIIYLLNPKINYDISHILCNFGLFCKRMTFQQKVKSTPIHTSVMAGESVGNDNYLSK